MIPLEEDIYQETRDMVLGKIPNTPLLIKLSDWFLRRYSVQLINFRFCKVTSKIKPNRYRLYIIIETTKDYIKMYNLPTDLEPKDGYQEQIVAEFSELALKYKHANKKQLKDVVISFHDFSHQVRAEANKRALQEVRGNLQNRFPFVWNVFLTYAGLVVFYFLDNEITEHEKDGINHTIGDTYYSLVKKYDDLNYFTRENIDLRFDSKENLDKNYNGSLSDYFH